MAAEEAAGRKGVGMALEEILVRLRQEERLEEARLAARARDARMHIGPGPTVRRRVGRALVRMGAWIAAESQAAESLAVERLAGRTASTAR